MSNELIRTPIETELDAFFGQYVAADQARGLAYGIVTADGLRHGAGFGAANDADLVPDPDTVFPIASMSKSFVAAAALVAEERGLLSLDDPITTYFPQFTASGTLDDPCPPPTLGMLFSMSGGLTEDNSWVDPFIDASVDVVLDQVAKGLRYSTVPGTEYEYSNLGYTLAGLAVGRAVGRPIEEFVRDEVLTPLGLTSTWFDNAAPAGIRRATGYSLDPAANWVPYAPNVSDAFAAAGGIMSTVRDLARWIAWLGSAFQPPRPGDVDILSRAARRSMQRTRIVDTPSLSVQPDGSLQPMIGGYGLGLRISLDAQRGTIVSHGGGLPGFSLFMCWHPDSGNGVVVLTNSHRGNPSELCLQALGRILARDRVPARTIVLWPETVRLRDDAERLIRSWDDELAARILADNVDFDRSLAERRADIEALVDQIGPLDDARPAPRIVSAATPADLTWSIPGARGELLCMIHLTPVEPAQIQELVVQAVPADRPRSAAPVDISPRRAYLRENSLTAATNTRVVLP
ncbi:penicillin-binding protein [Actinocatenispora thailandica]|uniref:Penicillin-binding protein n=1 Tax=Actinocatenispora thailandica TaxID=227318 RepID=A0A7R7HVD5_9ACTN|nr:serine hydrolase domain-containing protein [Actinocatenispora thailandica]BCJ34057.1 penicillin-binding protein [Actinocatenispora thailandica]